MRILLIEASKPRLLHATCRFSLSRSDSSQLAPSRPCFLGHILCSAQARALSCCFERLKDRGWTHKQRPCPVFGFLRLFSSPIAREPVYQP